MIDDRTPDGGTDADSPRSLWLATTPTTDYSPLEGGLHADVAVVGGGITGLTAAINLKEAGRDVVVVEADRLVRGATGYTTAKITSQHGLIYDSLLSKFGRRKAKQYADANEAAIDEIERRVEEREIDCDFERTEAYTYAKSRSDVSKIRDEVQAAKTLGLPASFTETTSLPFDVAGAIRFDDQAQFHPRKYLLAIAEAIHGDGSYVFEETRALDVDPGSPCRVSTSRGDVVADSVVVASHFPFFDRGGYFARMHPKRAYLLAVRVAETPPDGMYYSTASPPATIRPHPVEDGELVLVGGQSHKPGFDDGPSTSERYRRCEAFAREHFSVESIEYRWSTHDYSTVDSVPFVGTLGPGTENVYVGTGFGGWGMTGGTSAGLIISDLIVEGSNPRAEVFDPMRFTPRASARNFVGENAKVAAHFFGDRAESFLSGVDLPQRGEADVVRYDGRPTAVYHGEDGDLHAVSAVCSHMQCLVEWNDAERTWDCPCHGSRFSYEGDVVSGPALDGLPKRDF